MVGDGVFCTLHMMLFLVYLEHLLAKIQSPQNSAVSLSVLRYSLGNSSN
jgi:hypothetical protein